MKRSDIKVGEAYYYSRWRDWAEPRWSGADGKKAVVLSLDAHSARDVKVEITETFYWTSKPNIYKATVPITHLRGPYERTAAEVAEFVRKRDERRAAERAAQDAAADEAGAAYGRAAALGFEAHLGGGNRIGWVALRAADLQRLLDAFEQVHGKGGVS